MNIVFSFIFYHYSSFSHGLFPSGSVPAHNGALAPYRLLGPRSVTLLIIIQNIISKFWYCPLWFKSVTDSQWGSFESYSVPVRLGPLWFKIQCASKALSIQKRGGQDFRWASSDQNTWLTSVGFRGRKNYNCTPSFSFFFVFVHLSFLKKC